MTFPGPAIPPRQRNGFVPAPTNAGIPLASMPPLMLCALLAETIANMPTLHDAVDEIHRKGGSGEGGMLTEREQLTLRMVIAAAEYQQEARDVIAEDKRLEATEIVVPQPQEIGALLHPAFGGKKSG